MGINSANIWSISLNGSRLKNESKNFDFSSMILPAQMSHKFKCRVFPFTASVYETSAGNFLHLSQSFSMGLL